MSERRRPPSAAPRDGQRAPAPGAAPRAEGSAPRRRARAAGGWLPAVVGFGAAVVVGGTGLWASGCGDESTEDADRTRTTTAPATTDDGPAERAEAPPPSASAASSAAAAPAEVVDPNVPWTGPVLGAMAFQTPVYPETRFGDERLGYLRQGAKVPVDPKPIKKPNCKQGWYRLVDGGYVCGKYATIDVDHPRVKLGVKAPDLESVLPYKYAYNRFHGTPLYKKAPSRDEVERYEPYLAEERAAKERKAAEKKAERERATRRDDGAAGSSPSASASASASAGPPASPVASAPGEADETRRSSRKAKREPGDERDKVDAEGRPSSEGSAVPTGDDAATALAAVAELDAGPPGEDEKEPEKPWWQVANETGEKPAVTLADMAADAGGSLDRRMAKGFFVAVDKTVGWNGRSYFRTTSGLLAPTDRMWLNKPPESKGIEVPEKAKKVFFVLTEKARLFTIDGDRKKARDTGAAKRFAGYGMTGESVEIGGTRYEQTVDGPWLKSAAGTYTDPGPRPEHVGAGERWIDVDIDRKTLVLFEGDRPVYAALISPGKRSKDRKKNHATKTGVWRIREKHVAVTMDGDGAGGDLPYSIDDVPFVAYYDGSYALHGAFWHSNFGREMSHGCVNLSPLDAKHVFQFSEPRLPRGWHSVVATKERPGSVVSIHE